MRWFGTREGSHEGAQTVSASVDVERFHHFSAMDVVSLPSRKLFQMYRCRPIKCTPRRINHKKNFTHQKQKAPFKLACDFGLRPWVEALEGLIMTEDEKMFPLNHDAMFRIANIMEEIYAVPLTDVLQELGYGTSSQFITSVIKQLTQYLPCLVISSKSKHVVVDLNELSVQDDGKTFSQL